MSEYLRIKKTRILDVSGNDWTFAIHGKRIMLNELELATSSQYSAGTLRLFTEFLSAADAGTLASKWARICDNPPPNDTLILVVNDADIWNSVSCTRYQHYYASDICAKWTHWAPFPRWPA